MVESKADGRALTLRLSADEYDALRAFAFVSKLSINEAVRRAIKLLLSSEGAAKETYALFDAAKGSYRLSVKKIAKELDEGEGDG